MKLLCLLLLLCSTAYSQTNNNVRYIAFDNVRNAAGEDSIAWKDGHRLRHEFVLKGKTPIPCAITVIEQQNVLFSQYVENKWQVIDTLYYVTTPVGINHNDGYLTPAFMITDFNHDGNEDFMYWSYTNVNGNFWELLYLNHPDTAKLETLKTVPDEFDVWCAPEYDEKTGNINCTLDSSVFGVSEEYSYHLNGFEAVPLEKHRLDTTSDKNIYNIWFEGKNGQWEIVRQTIHLGFFGEKLLFYSLKQENDSIISLLRHDYPEGEDFDMDREKFVIQDTIKYNGWVTSYDEDNLHVPSYNFIDFDKDGNEDLIFYISTDVYGTMQTLIYLNDQKNKKLVRLYNTAENTAIWYTPQYDLKTGIITCKRLSGRTGVSFTSTYRLNKQIAIPLQKKEQDYANRNKETGKGGKINHYTGKNGKWLLKN